jgi:hypothetical protein
MFGAIQATPCKQACDLRNANSENLIRQDMVYAPFQVWNFSFQTEGQSAGDLAEKHTRFRKGV